jgi:hypothetical protein
LKNGRLTKWQDDKYTSRQAGKFQNGKLRKRQVDKTTSRENDKLIKQKLEQNYILTKQLIKES